MSSSQDDLTAYRFRRAKEALEDARILAESGRWNAVVGRLYYACFYAVLGRLLSLGHTPSTHRGARSLFNEHFVKGGAVSLELAQVYSALFERRQESDYADLVEFGEDQVQPWIGQAEEFVATLIAFPG